jgi:SAM-dependent methyltransferase
MSAVEQEDALRRVTERIREKAGLREFYREAYVKFAECLERCPEDGIVLELGSGGGFVRDYIPEAVTSDLLPYPGIDQVVDGTAMQFADESLRAILMLNVFHHISDCAAFLREASRCLMPGGRVFMVDQYPGWVSTPILRYLHREEFEPLRDEWEFVSQQGPLADANGALAWMVFHRDYDRFRREFPRLERVQFTPHTPLRYWLSGGLKWWSLLPPFSLAAAARLDHALASLSPRLCSFVDIELVKR